MAGGGDEEAKVSLLSVYRSVRVRGKQACDQILRRNSGARFGKRENVWRGVDEAEAGILAVSRR
jgi:hypothetical protein